MDGSKQRRQAHARPAAFPVLGAEMKRGLVTAVSDGGDGPGVSSFALMVESPHRRAERREPSVRNARLIPAGLGWLPSAPPWMCALYERSVRLFLCHCMHWNLRSWRGQRSASLALA